MNGASIIWTVILVLCLLVEASSVVLVSIWFAAGALAALIAAVLGAALWLQVVLFIVVSGSFLLALRPIMKKWIRTGQARTNLDAVIGSTGIVLETIDNIQGAGRVKLGAMEWSARSTDGTQIQLGTQVTVDRIEGVKVFVTPVPVKVGTE